MIRICLVGPDIYPEEGTDKYKKSFAYYSTSSDRFLDFNGQQVFTDWQDFLDAWIASGRNPEYREHKQELVRLLGHYESLMRRLDGGTAGGT